METFNMEQAQFLQHKTTDMRICVTEDTLRYYQVCSCTGQMCI